MAIGQGFLRGEPVRAALAEAVRRAAARPGHRETLITLGQGWVADEALAMAVYCALPAAAFRPAILLDDLEGRDAIERVADDLYDLFVTGQAPAEGRYPRT
ncbi:MAG: hypothetical protein ACRDPO_31300 [Streptosporangiaceae bacterium]